MRMARTVNIQMSQAFKAGVVKNIYTENVSRAITMIVQGKSKLEILEKFGKFVYRDALHYKGSLEQERLNKMRGRCLS